MKIFNRKIWLNFLLAFLSFYFTNTLLNNIYGTYDENFVSTMEFTVCYYWIAAFSASLLIAVFITVLYCKPLSPLFMAIGVFFGGIFSMYQSLYSIIINLDSYFREEGLKAFFYILPHFLVVLVTISAYLVGLLTKKEVEAVEPKTECTVEEKTIS